MKQAFCSLCAVVVLALACGGFSSSWAQTPSSTPEPFLIQLTSSPGAFRTTANDITANGRLVVFESNGDVASDRSETRNNADGNREIFIADYAQRRIFQITNTKNVPKPAASPTPSPTPTPAPTPADPTQIQIEIINTRPMISLEPALNASNQRVYTIVFSSNAPNPAAFDGVDTGGALAADGNTEIWIYQVPAIADVDLTTGANLPLQTLAGGTFTRITNTPATLLPTPGSSGIAPQIADDNRDATISDDGSRIAFISNANLVPAVPNVSPGNADRNPELFLFNRGMSVFVQATNTLDIGGVTPFTPFNQNPSLSGDGSVVAFVSAANLAVPGSNNDSNGRGNAEVYVANYNGSAVSNIRQATRTLAESPAAPTVNLFSSGRRLSRDGSLLAFESRATDPKANSATNETFRAVFVYNILADTFVRASPRPAAGGFGDVVNFPTFTDYNASLQPATLLFDSGLNFRTDGTFPATDQGSTGLNPGTNPATQIFATQAAATSSNTFTRLTKHPVRVSGDFQLFIPPLASNSRQRLAYSHGGADLGTGNADRGLEAFYLLSPPVSSELSAALSFFTGASEFPLPTPEASPAPTPSPGAITGLAPGELGILRTTVDFVASDQLATGGSETSRSPALPVELNGVSVSVNGAAAGLYFVGSTSRQINFVVPLGALPGVATVVVNSRLNGGTQLRGSVNIVPAQPDIFSAAGRAAIVNVTNAANRTAEPFTVTSIDGTGATVPTVLEVSLTGVRGVVPSEVKVTVGTTDITGASIVLVRPNLEMPGFDIINFTLPASLANSPNVPVVVTITRGTGVFSSRPAATAPLITISP